MHMDYPLRIDQRGRVAEAGDEAHIAQLIEQVLFTMPGERVNRPEFGTRLMQLVFDPNSDELATAVEYLVHGALQQWLGDLIQVEAIEVDNVDASLTVTVQYLVRRSQQRQVAQFEHGAQR
jgi:phage baseplate assembly protein W